MNKKSSETVYRSPDGQRWRLCNVAKYGDQLHVIRIKDGWVAWGWPKIEELTEESLWLKQQKKNNEKHTK